MSASEQSTVHFYAWPQEVAVTILPRLLRSHLPHSNALYNRILAPQNTPDRRCLFAASFAPPASTLEETIAGSHDSCAGGDGYEGPTEYTLLFADRSRTLESQCWIYSTYQNIDRHPSNPSHVCVGTSADTGTGPEIKSDHVSVDESFESPVLAAHVYALLRFLKETDGHVSGNGDNKAPTFDATIRFAMLHSRVFSYFYRFAQAAITYTSHWDAYTICASRVVDPSQSGTHVPSGFQLGCVQEASLDTVLATSSIPRSRDTMRGLCNAALVEVDTG